MKIAIIILAILICLMPSAALAQDDLNPRRQIADCLTHNVSAMWVYPEDVFLHPDYLTRLTGEQIAWLGYAPKSLTPLQLALYAPLLEAYRDELQSLLEAWGLSWAWMLDNPWWYAEKFGIEYGYGGINILEAQTGHIVYLYDGQTPVERWTITEYPQGVVIAKTTMDIYADSNGNHLDYHITAHPDGGACMWLVDGEAVEMMLGERIGS